jgi:hypothetical protein
MSVFRTRNNPMTSDRNLSAKREPYPINRVTDEPFPDGPTERIEKGARPRLVRRGQGGMLLVVLLTLLAVLLAGAAGLVAWQALGVARYAATERIPAVTPPTSVAPAADTGYSVAYAQEPLRVQVGCSAVLYLDLDEPRTNADEAVSDLRYDSRCGTEAPRLTLGPGAAGGAQIADSDTDAAGCDEAIRTSPLGPGASVEVKKGTVLCVLTADRPAQMALVEITDVGRTGVAGMRATSWKVAG